jgi:hypothetical protein
MTTHRSGTIQISRRAFAASLAATGVLGIGIGEIAATPALSQARTVASAAAAPAACTRFATKVGNAFEILGTLLDDAAKYPPLIPKAIQAGQAKSTGAVNAIDTQLRTINGMIETQAGRFAALKTPILSDETKCLG